MDIQLLDRPITGCDAELQIFAMEFGFRKLTGDYAAYLELFVPNMTFGEIANPNMIRDHLLKQRGSVETRDLFEGQK